MTCEEIQRLTRERDALRVKVDNHLFGYICVFCGNKTFYENEEERRIAMSTHLNECKRHPLHTLKEVEAERDAHRAAADMYKQQRDEHEAKHAQTLERIESLEQLCDETARERDLYRAEYRALVVILSKARDALEARAAI